jgi:hypothetical protein
MRRALLLLLAGIALLAGCGGGGGDDDEAGDATIQQLRIAYTSGTRTLTADTWTLRNGDDAAARSRLREGGAVSSDISLSDGFFALYTAESGGVVVSPAGSAPSPDPFSLVDGLVAQGALTDAGTVRRDGREVQVYTGSARPLLLGDDRGTMEPADASVRYLRDEAAGRPVELRIPAARIAPEGGPAARIAAQRYVVTGAREYAATEEAMEVFDLSAIYDDQPVTTSP